MKITQVTRKVIFDTMIAEGVHWEGSLSETEFLARLYDLESIPSNDHRFSNAGEDIEMHRVRNDDWDHNWVFFDPRFCLMNDDDEALLRFLTETVHPMVRADVTKSRKLVRLYNKYLKIDGFKLLEKSRMSGKPIYGWCNIGVTAMPGVSAVKESLSGTDWGYFAKQIKRMESGVRDDPGLAIGTAKELVETCCKTILQERSITIPNKSDLPALVKLTVKELKLAPGDIPDPQKATATIRHFLGGLMTITNGIAELRNQYGTGHGKTASSKGLELRHAKLAVGAASALVAFLFETNKEGNGG